MWWLFDVIGTLGVGCILLGYFMLQNEKWESDSYRYLFVNLIGALLILVSLYASWNLPAFIIETCWVLISLYGIMKTRKRRRKV